MKLTHIFLILSSLFVMSSCDKDDISLTDEYFENFQITSSLDGKTDVDLNPTIRFYPDSREYNMQIILYIDEVGKHYSIITSSLPYNTSATLGPLLQNRQYFYEIHMWRMYCNNPYQNCSSTPLKRIEKYTKIYSFKTKKLPDINTIKDIDGNVYETVKVGEQEWFAQSLRTSKYEDGTPAEYSVWEMINNSPNNPYDHYQYYHTVAVNNKNICPDGWHVPTLNDYENLMNTLTEEYGSDYAKEIEMYSDNSTYLSFHAPVWSSTLNGQNSIYIFGQTAQHDNSGNNMFDIFTESPQFTRPIRCIKD